jgi:hypothetical protein
LQSVRWPLSLKSLISYAGEFNQRCFFNRHFFNKSLPYFLAGLFLIFSSHLIRKRCPIYLRLYV